MRIRACTRWAWAIPAPETIEAIARFSPNGVVEVGAGTGYWAALLAKVGVDVAAYDRDPLESGRENTWCDGSRSYHPVAEGGAEAVLLHPGRTLLLCWPPYADSLALDCLERHIEASGLGARVVYVGEGNHGCTADANFHQAIGQNAWCDTHDQESCVCRGRILAHVVKEIAIPQWDGIHDSLHLIVAGARRLERDEVNQAS